MDSATISAQVATWQQALATANANSAGYAAANINPSSASTLLALWVIAEKIDALVAVQQALLGMQQPL
jgi:ApbE superfamily uncharacterized protein (UPF0280 family)